MIRKLVLTVGLSIAMLIGGTTAAFAATQPPATTTLTYGPGTTANEVVLDTNLTTAQRAGITEYDIQVNIVGQATRNLTLKKLPAMLFNIIPGTRIHAYLTLKGDFGTSPVYDGGAYTQPKFGATATPTMPVTPSSTSTVTPTPSEPATSAPTPTATAPIPVTTPTQTYTPPVTTSPAPEISTPTPTKTGFWAFINQYFTGILITAIITFLILVGIAIWIRRRRS